MDGFYYKGLNREEKSAYEQMLAGFKSLAPTIRITRLEPARLAEVYLRLKLDTPLLFHVTGYSYRFYPGAEHVELLPGRTMMGHANYPIVIAKNSVV